MNIIKTTEYDDVNTYKKIYFLDQSVQLDSLLAIIKYFENDKVQMLACHCDTFNENGNQMYRRYDQVDDINNFRNEPSPYANFNIVFGDRDTLEYRFSLSTGINLKYVKYIVDKKKILVNSDSVRSKR